MEFFKVKLKYMTHDVLSDDGEPTSLSSEFLVEGINYNDVEITVQKICDYYNLCNVDEPEYEISKFKSGVLMYSSSCYTTKPDSNGGDFNGLIMIHPEEDNFSTTDDSWGVHKAMLSYEDIEGKVQKETLHILSESTTKAFEMANAYGKKYIENSRVIVNSIKKEKIKSIFLSMELYETYKNITTSIGEELS